MGLRIEQVSWTDPRAIDLRRQMDAEMSERYSDKRVVDQAAVDRALRVEPADIALTLLAVDDDDHPLGHVAVRRLAGEWELKRLVTGAQARGRGVATALCEAAQAWVRDQGAPRLILQTGDRQPDAVHLYVRLGWTRIAIYPPYDVIPFSRCFEFRFCSMADPG